MVSSIPIIWKLEICIISRVLTLSSWLKTDHKVPFSRNYLSSKSSFLHSLIILLQVYSLTSELKKWPFEPFPLLPVCSIQHILHILAKIKGKVSSSLNTSYPQIGISITSGRPSNRAPQEDGDCPQLVVSSRGYIAILDGYWEAAGGVVTAGNSGARCLGSNPRPSTCMIFLSFKKLFLF